MSTVQVIQAKTYPKYVRYEARWSWGNLGFKPVIEKSEVPIRNPKNAPKLVFVYNSIDQPTYSRTYCNLVVIARDDLEEVVTKISELLESGNYLDSLELVQEIIRLVEVDRYRLSIDEDVYSYRNIKLIVY